MCIIILFIRLILFVSIGSSRPTKWSLLTEVSSTCPPTTTTSYGCRLGSHVATLAQDLPVSTNAETENLNLQLMNSCRSFGISVVMSGLHLRCLEKRPYGYLEQSRYNVIIINHYYNYCAWHCTAFPRLCVPAPRAPRSSLRRVSSLIVGGRGAGGCRRGGCNDSS